MGWRNGFNIGHALGAASKVRCIRTISKLKGSDTSPALMAAAATLDCYVTDRTLKSRSDVR